jgi:FAD:protein FMN transferase
MDFTMRLLLLTLLLLTASRPATATGPLKLDGPTMGTYYSIVVDSPNDKLTSEDLQSKVESRLAEINRQMSTWDSSSEISKFNQSTSTDWFEVSSEFAQVTAEARRIHELTAKAFDPTVAPLIDLWGFGDRREQSIPDAAKITEAIKLTGMQHLTVRLDPPALKKSIAGLQLNLSAIAKGYAVDVIAELLTTEGLPSFVVDIGGENRTGTAKATGDEWKLGVESPLGGLHRVVKLTQSAIATSGDYRNFFQIDGVSYSHAIDPTTGWPVRNPPASVSVIHESCMTADAWATAMMVLGAEQGVAIAEANNLSVMFQSVADETITENSTGLFRAAVADAAPVEVAEESLENDETPVKEQPAAAPWFPFVAAAVIFLIAIAGMSIGTMLQNKSIKGSCGGLASMPGSEGKSICELCTIPKNECTNTELREMMQAAAANKQCEDHDA